MGGEGREGDWECISCKNRNYAFRSFCNRCKQPRLLVDTKTPADSKWLPRIGDWICTGCTNNNYASREKCKKCGQPRELAAMSAIAMPGVSLPTYPRHFARAQGGLDPNMNIGLIGNSASFQQPLHLNRNWHVGGADKHGLQPIFSWPMGGPSGLPYANLSNQSLTMSKGWRNGDWLCNCGFHNYSSRAQCKKCNAFPQAVGTKRLASDEFVQDLDNKRLNVGHINGHQQQYTGFEPLVGIADPKIGPYTLFPNASSGMVPMPLLQPQQAVVPTIVGKGAKQWRDGDWMCKNCSNHNYASRTNCNRCKTQRDDVEVEQAVNVV